MNIIKLVTAISKCIAICVIGIQMAQAGKSVTVDSISDQPEPGFTTLREAIELSNTAAGVEINFDAEVFSSPQTITLENGEMLISSSMIINGPGAGLLIIDANNLSRIFTLFDNDPQSAPIVSIFGITLSNGNGESAIANGIGGCIYSAETLKLSASIIKNCSADNGGGGVRTSRAGNLIENSTFLNNSAGGNGGGLVHSSSVGSRIIGSTFSGNSASKGGGIQVSATGSFFVINSTFSNNQAKTGAAINADSAININNSTIVDNLGQGINLTADNIQNNIIAGNTDGDCFFDEVGFDNLNNFSGDGSCDVLPQRGDIIADPMLGPLADNGGLTLTHLPLIGSPVIDSGDECFCAQFDQRGLARPIDGDGDEIAACDIGAVEVTTLEDSDLIFSDGFDEFINPVQVNENFTLIRGC